MPTNMTRNEFLKTMLTVVGGAWAVKTLSGCSDSGMMMQQDGGPTANCLINGTTVAISANHTVPGPHTLMVSKGDVAAGVAKSYDIEGAAGHSHTVNLTAAHFTMLSQNNSVSVISTTTNLHEHMITVMCA